MAGIFVFLLVLVLFVIISALSFGLYILNKLLGGFSAVRGLFSQLFGSAEGRANAGPQSRGGAASQGMGDAQGASRAKGAKGDADADPFSGDCNNDVSHTNKKVFSPNEGEYVDYEEVK